MYLQVWADLKNTVRKKLRKMLVESNKTGGGKNTIRLTELEERIIAITGMTVTVDGLPGRDFLAEADQSSTPKAHQSYCNLLKRPASTATLSTASSSTATTPSKETTPTATTPSTATTSVGTLSTDTTTEIFSEEVSIAQMEVVPPPKKRFRPTNKTKVLNELQQQRLINESFQLEIINQLKELNEISRARLQIEKRKEIEERKEREERKEKELRKEREERIRD